jgi:hypothetical protein
VQYVIEFRNGSFFQNLEADHGGPKKTAQKFNSKQECVEFIKKNPLVIE